MASLKPFCAIYYNKKKIKDFSKVMSPPYDVISEEMQTALHNLSPYNFTHLDFAKDRANDTASDNKYTRAKASFEEWLKKGALLQDETEAVYLYKQDYKVMGQKHSRLGFIGLLELENENESKVYPHENTHKNAVDDRFQLTKALNAYLSCIFVCYADRQRKVEKIFNKHVMSEEPMIDLIDDDGVHHRLWRLDDPKLIKEIKESVEGQNLFIADGHHRYQMAQEYRKMRAERKNNVTGQEPFNYVMTYFTNLDSKDLQIFPMHRIVKTFPDDIEFLEEYFRIDKVKTKEELLILLAKAGINEHAFGLYTKQGIRLLRLKNKLLIDQLVQKGSPDYKSLDATILKAFIFDQIGIKSDQIMYTKDMNDVTQQVDYHQAAAGFIMNPVKIQQLKQIALNGERMPPKTTYFYPKVLSGLTVYKMD